MFTGIIEGLGTVAKIETSERGKKFTFKTDFPLEQTKIGDSIDVSGVCLTVVMIKDRLFAADASPETLARTTLGAAKIGERVNLERALRLSDRLGGHLVSGHIDGLGRIAQRKTIANAIRISIEIPVQLSKYIIPKGSIAVDGTSLTINDCQERRFEVSIIPHTAKLTTIGLKKERDLVNIETDMIGKYVERFLKSDHVTGGRQAAAGSGLDMNLLAKSGFL
ncbi:MAG: riboflavin synthase [Desulfobacterales bacterium]